MKLAWLIAIPATLAAPPIVVHNATGLTMTTVGELFQEKTKVKYVLVDGPKFQPTAETPTPSTESAQ